MKSNYITNNSRRAVIIYTESSYAGVSVCYVQVCAGENNTQVKSKDVFIEYGEPLYKDACRAMVGDELEFYEDGAVKKICIQSLWRRLKNYWFLFKNRKCKNKSTL